MINICFSAAHDWYRQNKNDDAITDMRALYSLFTDIIMNIMATLY